MAEPRTAGEMFFRRVRAIARHLADADCPPNPEPNDSGPPCGSCPLAVLDHGGNKLWFDGCISLELARLTGGLTACGSPVSWDDDG